MVKQANNLEIHSFLKYFEDYIDRAKQDSEQKPLDGNTLCVTTNYNLGRIYEGLFMCDKF